MGTSQKYAVASDERASRLCKLQATTTRAIRKDAAAIITQGFHMIVPSKELLSRFISIDRKPSAKICTHHTIAQNPALLKMLKKYGTGWHTRIVRAQRN